MASTPKAGKEQTVISTVIGSWDFTRQFGMHFVIFPIMILLSASAGCQTLSRQAETSGSVQHVVICWLKKPADAQARERLIDSARSLAAIPGLIRVRAGTALPSSRPVADSTFDVAIVMSFEDESALQKYLEHPVHKRELRSTIIPLVGKLVVYDFIEP